MFGLTEWKQTRFYQEVRAENRQERDEEIHSTAVPRMVKAGLNIEQIAEFLDVDTDTVRKYRDRIFNN